MFKFTIEAESLAELEVKLNNWAAVKHNETLSQKAVHNILTQAVAIEQNDEAEEVVESIQHAQTATVPHLVAPPVINQTPLNNKDELDKRGLPWDARIHSAGRSLNQDGSWRNRRGVDPHLVAQVEKENSSIAPSYSAPPPIPSVPFSPAPAAMPSFAPPQVEAVQYQNIAPVPVQPPPTMHNYAPPVQPAPVLNVPDQTQSKAPAEDQMNKAYMDAAFNPPVASAGKPAHTYDTFVNNLVTLLAQLITEKKINQSYIASLCEHFQVKNIWNVTASAKQSRELYDSFAEFGFITKLD